MEKTAEKPIVTDETKVKTEKAKVNNSESWMDDDPFTAAAVDEKSYNVGNNVHLTPDKTGTIPDIPEQTFDMPNIDINIKEEPPKEEEPKEAPKKEPTPPANPQLIELPKKEQKKGAELLVDMLIQLHKFLYEKGYNLFELSDEKLKNRAYNGKFNLEILNVSFPLSETEIITVGEFIETYNKQLAEIFKEDEVFYDEIRQPLIELFIQKGWGVTQEQYVLYKILLKTMNDAAVVVSASVTLKGVLKNANTYFTEVVMAQRQGVQQQPPKQQQPKKQTQQQVTVENDNFEAQETPIRPIVIKDEKPKKEPKTRNRTETVEPIVENEIEHSSEQYESDIMNE